MPDAWPDACFFVCHLAAHDTMQALKLSLQLLLAPNTGDTVQEADNNLAIGEGPTRPWMLFGM